MWRKGYYPPPPPEWLKKVLPIVFCFVDASIDSKKEKSEPTIPEGIAFSCPRCGAMLVVDGKNRLVPCDYCKLQVYLPDDLWLRIHPVEKKKKWFVVYDEKAVEKRKEEMQSTDEFEPTEEEGQKITERSGFNETLFTILCIFILGILLYFLL
ncbi:MAG: hypothetical protein GF308_14755 [Candidatus Heimdallarchaeota archaeon]|nr:hypothetical protein [Candidatus Heimdallarchaeota archaeon]